MKPVLTKRPNSYVMNNLLVKFAGGKPLASHELHFLDWHEKTLSFCGIEEMLRYYLKPYRKKSAEEHSFVLPQEKLNPASVDQLKRRLQMLLQNGRAHAALRFTPEQFQQLRAILAEELVLYHGNQYLTGAPFYPGGIPYVLIFQWGNLFGIAKQLILPDEMELKGNVLIHFEDMFERSLDQCTKEYVQTHQAEQAHENQLKPTEEPPHTLNAQPSYQTPRLTLSMNTEKDESNGDKS